MELKIVFETDLGGGLNEEEFYQLILLSISNELVGSVIVHFTKDFWGDQLLDSQILKKLKKRYANKEDK